MSTSDRPGGLPSGLPSALPPNAVSGVTPGLSPLAAQPAPDAAGIMGGVPLAAEVARLANAFFSQWPTETGRDRPGVVAPTVPSPSLPEISPPWSREVTPEGDALGRSHAGASAGSPGAAAAPLPGAGSPGALPLFHGPSPFNELPRFTGATHFLPSALQPGFSGASSALTAPPVPGPAVALPPASAPHPKESDLRNLPALFGETLGFSSPIPLLQGPAEAGSPGAGELYFLDSRLQQSAGSSALRAPTSSSPAAPGTAPALISSQVSGDLGARNAADRRGTPGMFDANAVKRDFPILNERVHGKRLIWLDNAATTQKPRAVIERLAYYYEHENSNVHRAAHAMAARATDAYEAARGKVRRFLGASASNEIVFARGATEAINLVAQSWGRRNVGPGDEILITWLEHHANIVPWQRLCAEKGARLCVAPVDERGQVILEEFERLLGPRTRLVSFTQVSNALGTILPAREMVQMAHRHGARVLVDGAQAVSHMPVDVQALDCDFYCFSGHKVFAPTGIGVLFGKAEVLEAMPPWQGGGNMISDVTFEKTTYQPPPLRFEAGTGNIADAVGLGAALEYVESVGLENIRRYEHELLEYATAELHRVPGLRMIGTAPEKAGVLSFTLDGWRTEDVGGALDRDGIAVRSGHHCAQPILRRFGVESTVRASLAPYNTCEDIDALVATLLRLQSGHPGAPSDWRR